MADFQEIYGRVFQIYLEATFTFPIIVILSDLHTTHYVPVVPNVAREEDGTTSLCVERQNTQRVRVDRLRGSPTSHLLSHLATSDNGRFSG
jgi:hypothetical protein